MKWAWVRGKKEDEVRDGIHIFDGKIEVCMIMIKIKKSCLCE